MAKTQEAPYTVISKDESVEIRRYEPLITAYVEVSGERKEAINEGFRLLADFIFGNNTSRKQIAMTAPVIQQKSEKIAMTAPVMQQKGDGNWRITFVMPAHFTLETLPKPNNNQVRIEKGKEKKVIVITFSGRGSETNIENHLKELRSYIEKNRVKIVGEPIFAFYNPPWTLPFWRRNEIMFLLAD
ncbi:MAG TPA: heme-binding protein [Candidatus Babeliales bacterium]|nr:heme-binding protein [Candidatus Babeliales bacterium]